MLVEYLIEPLGDRLKVASCQSTIRRKPLRNNEEIARLRCQSTVVHCQKSPHVDKRILLGAHGAPGGEGKNLAGNFFDRLLGVSFLPLLDEISIFGESARVEKQRYPMFLQQLFRLSNVL